MINRRVVLCPNESPDLTPLDYLKYEIYAEQVRDYLRNNIITVSIRKEYQKIIVNGIKISLAFLNFIYLHSKFAASPRILICIAWKIGKSA